MKASRFGLGVLLAVVCLFGAVTVQAGEYDKYLSNQVACGEMAQHWINQGKNQKAVELLAQGVAKYPDSDWLRSLYGRALFTVGKLDEAEDQFQQALEINKDNPVARKLIKEVRLTKDALLDREMNEFLDLAKDKMGDLVVIVIGVWFGTLMSMLSGKFANLFRRSSFEKAFRRKDWHVVTDILEGRIANWEKEELRKNMEMMLTKLSVEEAETIIRDYVDVQRYEDELLFFLRKMNARR